MKDNNSPKDYKIVFNGDKFSILDELLKKYKLEGLDEKALNNLDGENLASSPSIIILEIVNDVVEGLLETKKIPEILKTSLNLSNKDASALSKDIKEKLIAICKKVKISGENIAAIPEKQIDPTKTARPARLIDRDKDIIKKTTEPETEEIEEQLPKTVLPQERPKSSGPDSYREPIE